MDLRGHRSRPRWSPKAPLTRSEELNAVGKKTEIGQFVRENQYVTVKYWEEDGTRYMQKLRVH